MGGKKAAHLTVALPLAAFVALRYLKSTRRDAMVSLLSALAGGGIALGVAALVLALAALSGFQQALRSEILERTSEIEILLPRGGDAVAVAAEVAATPGVRSVQQMLRGRGWLVVGGQARPVVLVGYERVVPRAFPDAAGRSGGLFLGDRAARLAGLEVGDLVEVVSVRPTLTPLGPTPRLRRLRVAGTFRTGEAEQEERIALPLAEAEALLGSGERRLEVATGGLEEALAVARGLETVVPPGARIESWRQLNRPLFFALRLEKTVMFVAVSLIVLVAALALVADLSVIIANKRPEVGMLRAMGATGGDVLRIFALLGGLLTAGGALGGAVLGVGGAWFLDHYRLIRLPGHVYFLDHIPFWVRPGDLGAALGLALALGLGCALFAARRAAALDPVVALRR